MDADPLTAAIAQANAEALGSAIGSSVRAADASTIDPAAFDVLFADPARRTARGRTFDPMGYSPPWPDVLAMVAKAGSACLKVAPGIPYEFIPAGAEAEWVSYKGDVKEAVIWCGALAGETERRATILPSGDTMTPDPDLGQAGHGPVGRYIYEPDGAAIRAHLVAEIAATVEGHLLDPHIAYITGDVAGTDTVGVPVRGPRDAAVLAQAAAGRAPRARSRQCDDQEARLGGRCRQIAERPTTFRR